MRLGSFGGPLAFIGVFLLGTEPGRKALKKVTREAAKVGVYAYDKFKELAAEAREEATALIEEVKTEHDGSNGKGAKVSAKKSEG